MTVPSGLSPTVWDPPAATIGSTAKTAVYPPRQQPQQGPQRGVNYACQKVAFLNRHDLFLDIRGRESESRDHFSADSGLSKGFYPANFTINGAIEGRRRFAEDHDRYATIDHSSIILEKQKPAASPGI